MEDQLVLEGLIYSEFEEDRGPIPKSYIPQSLDQEIIVHVAVVSLTSSFMGEETFKKPQQGYQAFPLLRHEKSILSQFFTLPNDNDHGFTPATLNLLFKGPCSVEFMSKSGGLAKQMQKITDKIKKAKTVEQEDYLELHKALTGKPPEPKPDLKTTETEFKTINGLLNTTMAFSPTIKGIIVVNSQGKIIKGNFLNQKSERILKKAIRTKGSLSFKKIESVVDRDFERLTMKFKDYRLLFASLGKKGFIAALIQDSLGIREDYLVQLVIKHLKQKFL